MNIDVTLSDRQVKQLSLAISIDDVLNCIKKDYKSYLDFLNDELLNQEITRAEYEEEMRLIKKLKNGHMKEVS